MGTLSLAIVSISISIAIGDGTETWSSGFNKPILKSARFKVGPLQTGYVFYKNVDRVSVPSLIAIDILMDTMARDRVHMYTGGH